MSIEPLAPWQDEALTFAIGIPTYQRPRSLARLLDSLRGMVWPDSWVFLGVVVVDNDRTASAQEVVEAASRVNRWPVHYVVESTAGVASVRNRILDESGVLFDPKPLYVAMIDDDEVIGPGWPKGLLEVAQSHQADLVGGMVSPRPEVNVPSWMLDRHFLGRTDHPDHAVVERLTAGNILIRRAITDDGGECRPVRFDAEFETSGGEDSRFCAEVRRRGGQIRWSSDALSYEVVPAERCTVEWLRQRWRRTGATMVMVQASLATDKRARLSVRARGALTGMARIVRSLDPRARSDAARAEMTRQRMLGVGQMEGALGRRPLAYGPQGFETAATP